MTKLHIIGGGLAGSEAAWAAAEAGLDVVLHEMRPVRGTFAHQTDELAELVCSNSFRSDDALNNAVGLLHEEMRRAGSLVMRMADRHKLPAGGALAVDRARLFARGDGGPGRPSPRDHRPRRSRRPAAGGLGTGDRRHRPPHLRKPQRRHRPGRRAKSIWPSSMPSRPSSIAIPSISTSPGSSRAMTRKAPAAAMPITSTCRWTEEQYRGFVAALIAGEKTDFKEWEKSTPYFEACLPIEVMAARGEETLRFGPMKPVGLQDPRKPAAPPCRGAAAPGQCAWHPVEHGGISDQTEAMASRSASSAPFRDWRMRNSPGWADCTATPSSIRPGCWMANCG